jgi:hypothetical protein
MSVVAIHSIPFCVRSLEFEPQSRPRQVGAQFALYRLDRAIEKHLLDTGVIVKIFDVDGARRCAAQVCV